jgi:hypothetical protein
MKAYRSLLVASVIVVGTFGDIGNAKAGCPGEDCPGPPEGRTAVAESTLIGSSTTRSTELRPTEEPELAPATGPTLARKRVR